MHILQVGRRALRFSLQILIVKRIERDHAIALLPRSDDAWRHRALVVLEKRTRQVLATEARTAWTLSNGKHRGAVLFKSNHAIDNVNDQVR